MKRAVLKVLMNEENKSILIAPLKRAAPFDTVSQMFNQ